MTSVTAATPEHYRKLHLTPGVVEPWEDGLRTEPSERGFEWWYFECHLDDGSKLTVDFHTKPPYVSPSQPLTPYVSLTLDRPDGTALRKSFTGDASSFSASRDRCDVRIGANRFAGDPTNGYEVRASLDDVSVDVKLVADVPAWRPATGHVLFGEDESLFIAWLPVVPGGRVDGTLTIGGRAEPLRGAGYHDHNWGNVAIRKVVDHWYWGRARVGDYTIITLMFHAHAQYGGNTHPAFMVAKGGNIIAASQSNVRFLASDRAVHPTTGAPFAQRLAYTFEHLDSQYVVTFEHRKNVFEIDFGNPGAYLRFLGDVTLEHRSKGDLVETVRGEALWELLYFGKRAAAERRESA